MVPDPAGWPGLRGPGERRLLERYGPQGGARTGAGIVVGLGPHLLLDTRP
ncbi:hypothetical protein SMALA_2249 [Streptomyces malaysiensis subsp. malaysiensis]|nr:hypothetical protein SMALA_2249 [Streptomyces malaysiensis]